MGKAAIVPILLCAGALLLLLIAGCVQSPQPASPGPATPVPVPSVATVTPVTPVSAAANESARAGLVSFVKEAVAYAKTNGKAAALAEFDKKNGSFFRGELYIYAYDLNGTTIAHPVNPEKIGVSRINEKDAAGNFFIQELRDAAKNGGGFIEYYYINPTHANVIEKKLGYVEKVDDTWWLGSGIYDGTAGLVVTPDISPAARATAFIAKAKEFALKSGKERALAEFNNRNGSFIDGDLYIFAYDYNGTVLAWPYRSDMIGVDRADATDPSGKMHIREMISAARNGSGVVQYYTQNPLHNNATELKSGYIQDVDGTWFIGTGIYDSVAPVVTGTLSDSPVSPAAK